MRALLVPGRAYPAQLPLLHFAGLGLREHGHDVEALAWVDPPPTEAWVRAQVDAAVGASTEPVLLVGKSLGTRASSYAAERGWPAIWLTPLLLDPACVAGIRANPARQLLVGGRADDIAWDTEVAASLLSDGCDVLEVPDADHAMATASAVRTAEIQVEVSRAIDLFLRAATPV